MADDGKNGSTSPSNTVNNLPTPPSASDQDLKPFSCILCKQRKIKCDKHYPCQNCTKAKAQCIFRAPAPPRRGKRKPAEVNLLARLKRYEDMLQGLGVAIEKLKFDDDSEKPAKPPSESWASASRQVRMGVEKLSDAGKLISEEGGSGKSLYVEDNLWTSLSEELKDSADMLGGSSEDEDENLPIDRNAYEVNSTANQLIFNLGTYTPSLRIPHPPISHVRQLWEVYKSNFDPLNKLLHIPSAEPLIFSALQDTSRIPKNLEALIYSVYCGALTSLDSAETQAYFGEDQPPMMARYKLAAQQALLRAGLLKSSDLIIVQAHTIYLLAHRLSIDPRSLWMLTGINMRLSHRIGLHRDGTHLGLPPFETEIRRRLWWQVLILDTHSAILSGSGGVIFHNAWDTKAPLNINDVDIWPSMEAPPLAREGSTEMFFCLLRHEFGKFFRVAKLMHGAYQSVWQLSMEEKNKQINDVEVKIEQKFLRYCDPLNPLHHLAQSAGRSAVASMRLMANQPRFMPDKGASMSAQQKHNLYLNALKIIEYDSMSYSDPRLRGYRWHVRAYFQYNAFVFVLTELCHRGSGEDVERAWDQVSQVFKNHPELKAQRSLQVAIGKLVCKAWVTRAKAMIQAGEQPVPPSGVAELLAFRAQAERNQHSGAAGTARQGSTSASTSSGPSPGNLERFLPEQSWPGLEDLSPGIGNDQTPAAWVGGPWMRQDLSGDDIGLDLNAIQQEPTPIDWAAWDEIFRDNEKGSGLTMMGMGHGMADGYAGGDGGAIDIEAMYNTGMGRQGGFKQDS